jgi:two-component system, chemotaxis family, CheB/CheR fusion protein
MSEIQHKDDVKLLSSNLFPVVGVGASAGGLEAFKRLIKAIPENSGMAFILVQHLEPTHESILPDILQKVTSIPIHEITNNVRVEPNMIYIIPSNKLLTATDGVLQLKPRPPKNEKNLPIDVFFTSLAEVHQSHAIGVILSGTASDGTLGLKAIKDHGGITFAQDQESAAFKSMPQSAIDAEVVDFILRPEEIPSQLLGLNQTLKNHLTIEPEDLQLKKEDAFRQILSLLRVRKGVDFTYYKQTTIRRRIIRRMSLNKMTNISDYLSHIRENKSEQDVLYQDLLIPVTEFFRDSKTFDVLCDMVFPLLLKDRDESIPIRIWVAGCSTGEEPYSIAMCLHEYIGDSASDMKIQVFATDISEKSIAKARNGLYSKSEIQGLSTERLQKYFTHVNGGFQLDKLIRNMCIFAAHNFLKDPPFARMDLISCRNVLIYMEPILQKKALTTFHYALKEKGYLLLGKSETTGMAADLFFAFDKHDKLYSRKSVPGKFLHVVADRNEKLVKDLNDSTRKTIVRDDFQKSADDILLSRFSPPGVVVNDQMEIVQFRGSTGNWLESSSGKPSLNILKMAREGLAFELRSAIHKVRTSNKPVIKENISMHFMGTPQLVSFEVIPISNTEEPYFLILFKNSPISIKAITSLQVDSKAGSGEAEQSFEKSRIQVLENELSLVREDMKSITEEQEAVNEELQSANEELLSGSEELQSLNEELETSKEEIQSTNEELTTLNQELFDRNDQLNLSRLYAESIVATVREPLIILDKNMIVKTANRSYYEKFKTTEEETEGKSFFDLENGQWSLPTLRAMLEKVLLKERVISGFEFKQVFSFMGERSLLLNATLFSRESIAEQLVLVAIEDVTDAKRLEAEQKLFTLELERKVVERTVALQDAIASLKHSNENLEQFATIASHDLQEPLRKIMTFANLLNKRHFNEIDNETNELLGKINQSAERMSALIKGVLNFSKVLDTKRKFEKTDLNEILLNVIGDFDLSIVEKKAEIKHDHLPIIDGIPSQINQLFYNLLSNSLKFSVTASSPIITITSRILTSTDVKKQPILNAQANYAEIIFADNGIGFDQQFAEQTFLIFERLNSWERFEGTGIGLALCKRIVLNHQGIIYAESKIGEGAQFHIILPVMQ